MTTLPLNEDVVTSNEKPNFENNVVFVAGGSSGINLGIAQAFARHRAKVCVLSRSREKIDAALETMVEQATAVQGFVGDVRDYAVVESAMAQTHKQFGAIDILISGAAGNFAAPAADMSANAFKSVVDIDLLGSFHVLRAAYPYLCRPGASVINVSAPQAVVPMALQAHVCAAKAGVDMLTRVLAIEWGAAGIRVNSIMPGPIEETEGMRRLAPSDALRQKVTQSVPLQRMGRIADISNAVLMLCSPWAAFINGVVLPVDGGWHLSGAAVAMTAMAYEFKHRQP